LNVAARGLRTIHPSDLADILEELDRQPVVAFRSSILQPGPEPRK